MSAIENSMDLVFTSSAAQRVQAIIAEEGKGEQVLRVFVQGGGCSGFQYGFQLEETISDDDILVETDGIRLVVDPMSLQYLAGAEVDFVEGLQGAQFVINNPNATTTCGCGSSFTI